ncbi:MAG: efflux RND transporter periplasmic adaptor subunit [Rikenellaceae bacterium]
MKRLFIAASAIALITGCGAEQSQEGQESSAETKEVAKVATKSDTAKAETISLIERFTAEITAYRENNILPAANGVRVERIFFEVGDRVNEGDVVATLDPTMYNQHMIQVANLQADYDRLLPVYEAGGISRQTLDQAKTALDIQVEVARNMKKNIELISPITGFVTHRNMEEGDLFSSQPILHIAQMDKLKVLIPISEQYFRSVKVGMDVTVEVDIYSGKSFKGEVSLIYPALDASTRTFTAEVTLHNDEMLLRPGMYGRTTFNMGRKAAILVEDVAVQKQYGSAEYFVYVIEDGVARRRSVERGRQVGSKIDILSGLKAGEEVVATGFSRISDGTALEVK